MKFKQAINVFLQFFKYRNNCVKDDPEIDVQEVFNKVIDAGYFKKRYSTLLPFMCRELRKAVHAGVISTEECTTAEKEISQYLGKYGTLWLKLLHLGLPHAYADRLFIYRNWNNRP